jgi:hypothetical protein
MVIMDGFHQLLRIVHVLAGFVGLVAFWIPVVAKKGGRLHIAAGRVFTWALYVVGTSALVSSSWALLAPDSFVGLRQGSPGRAGMTTDVTGFGAFLGMIALLVLSSARFGIRATELKRYPRALDRFDLRALHAATAIAGAGNVILAALTGQVLLAIFGVLGVQAGWDYLRVARNPLPTRMAWWYQHMSSMLGGGIAFHTAFLVFGARHWLQTGPHSWLALVPWLLPSLIGIPAIRLWTRAYRRRFGEMDEESRSGGMLAPSHSR